MGDEERCGRWAARRVSANAAITLSTVSEVAGSTVAPFRSATCPETGEPAGRARKAGPNTANDDSSAVAGLDAEGKTCADTLPPLDPPSAW